MTTCVRCIYVLLLALLISALRPSRAEQAVPWEELVQLCRPTKHEMAWQAVPWMTDLWAARIRGAELNRPILLWLMDGHPLGCT